MLRKDQILERALELFNEKGYVDVGVREIARELGISPGNLSYHFNKKEDILLALLSQFSEQNNSFYEDYAKGKPSLGRFLGLMQKIFLSQFKYRGVYIGNQVVQAELQTQDRFDYRKIARKREESFQRMFEELRAAGQLELSDEDVRFLVSYITLFARFWISEATLFDRSPDLEKTIDHYMWMLTRQVSLFATKAGLRSMANS